MKELTNVWAGGRWKSPSSLGIDSHGAIVILGPSSQELIRPKIRFLELLNHHLGKQRPWCKYSFMVAHFSKCHRHTIWLGFPGSFRLFKAFTLDN
jgi:hypothetical protein